MHGVPPPLSWKGEARAPAPDLAGSHRKFLDRSSPHTLILTHTNL